ncbi:uncharacterized protein LOC127104187 [Lathyrus oleraceus]|uniref:uncharacterized protein LOC127104187 n=1 Tax=Pisum sativum TaxID=3888 RepID=UPI0021CEEFC7|nr:uncharacterized protein LOC127104187 [Pisum sativum]
MACSDAYKVMFGTHMSAKEVEYWWNNTRQRLKVASTEITWQNIKSVFLKKYFPDDVRIKMENEFLELKQGNMIVVDYVVKFEELSRFFSHYNGVGANGYKCIKFESVLRQEIKQFIRYQEILQFYMLVIKCKIYNKDSCARYGHYKSVSEKRSGSQNCGKPYEAPTDKGKWKASGGKRQVGEEIMFL